MKEKISGVYCIENIVNRKKYIGSSADILGRWREHKKMLNSNCHHSIHLQNAWNKYMEENFNWTIIEETSCDSCDRYAREQKWIDYFDSFNPNFGYNIVRFANGGPKVGFDRAYYFLQNNQYVFDETNYHNIIHYFTLSNLSFWEIYEITGVKVEVLRSIFDRMAYVALFEKYMFLPRRKNPNKRYLNEREVKEIIEKLLNREYPEELSKEYGVDNRAIRAIRDHENWKWLTKDITFPKLLKRKRTTAVCQYNYLGERIGEYNSITNALKATGIGHADIIACCGNKRTNKLAGGFAWIYKDKLDEIENLHDYIQSKFNKKNTPVPIRCIETEEVFDSIIDVQRKYKVHRTYLSRKLKNGELYRKKTESGILTFSYANS